MATKRKPRVPTVHDRARKAHGLLSGSVVALRTILAKARFPTQRAYLVKNVDATVDASIVTVTGDPFTQREAESFMEKIERSGPIVDDDHFTVNWGVFDEWLFQDTPGGYLFFSYKFKFLHPGELSDKERARVKKRRYVARIAAGRGGYLLSTAMHWMPAGPNAITPGRWSDGHQAARDDVLDCYLKRYPGAQVVGIEFRLRWTPDGSTPSRVLLGIAPIFGN